MCECFKKITDSIEDELKGKNEVKVKWQNRTFFLDGKYHAPTTLKVETEHRQTKVDGSPYRNLTKNTISCILKFCPFCGVRIEETE